MERRANVEGWFIPVAAGHPRAGQRGGGRLGRGGQGLELGLDGGVARGELRLTQVKEFEILLQDEGGLTRTPSVVRRQPTALVVVLNWFEELKGRVPTH